MLKFIIQHRLHWKAEGYGSDNLFLCSSPIPFFDKSDFRILRNDWPYYLEEGTVHLVAWSKTPISTDEYGDPTPLSSRFITSFLNEYFAAHIKHGQNPGDNIQWFRNRTKWQSIRSLDHIHILMRDADDHFVTEITGQGPGDIVCRRYKPEEQ